MRSAQRFLSSFAISTLWKCVSAKGVAPPRAPFPGDEETESNREQGVGKAVMGSVRAHSARASLRRRVLSRVSVAPRALPPRRRHQGPQPQKQKEAEEEANNEQVERVVRGGLAATLALTQVLSAANADVLQRTVPGLNTTATAATLEPAVQVGDQAGPSLLASSVEVAPSVSAAAEEQDANSAPDLYRDTFVRYAGYANEVGESFKNIVSRTSYKASYAVAIAYVLADAADKGMKAEAIAASLPTTSEQQQNPNSQAGAKNPQIEAVKASVDTLVWQSLASVVIPGFTINRIVWLAKKLTDSVDGKLPAPARKWAPTLIGLSFIPFIVHPIDEGVTKLLDLTIRTFY